MKPRLFQALVVIFTVIIAPSAFALRNHRGPTSGSAQRQHFSSRRKAAPMQIRGQRAIDPARATEIQQALIRENYLSGSPTGIWDGATEAAMLKFQGDHGWQTRLTPDSRALIKLGLGPKTETTAQNEISSPAGMN